MPGFGYGVTPHHHRYGAPHRGSTEVSIPVIQPASVWDGTAGSGFASTPIDPVRTMAKPAVQLMVPPNQHFTDKLIIGVLAGANDGGTLFTRLGLERVDVHCEGNVQAITEPTLYRFTDVNGTARSYLGWWIELEHTGINGELEVFFEAIPDNPSLQNRVIGPYSFFPQRYDDGAGGWTPHDLFIEVAPSQPKITNQRYQSLRDAGNICRNLAAQNPLITITESGTYTIDPINGAYQGDGYATVEATAQVTIAKAAYIPGDSTSMRWRYDGMWLRGGNITVDFANIGNIYHENPANRQHVFEGVNFTDTRGRGALWLKGQKPTPYIARDNPYFLECTVELIQNPCLNASLVRGCFFNNLAYDVMSYARCMVGNIVTSSHNVDWRTPLPALSVQYTGAASAATIELSGSSDANNRVLKLRTDGLPDQTFTIGNQVADYQADTHYSVQNVVDWINANAGWAAVLIDDSRRASALSHANAAGLGAGFSAIDAKTSSVDLHTVFDIHGDIWAINLQSSTNSIMFGNTFYGNALPAITLGYDGMEDLLIINNAAESDEALNPDFLSQFSQWSKPSSHVVVAHNTLANQIQLIRPSQGLTADEHCMLANNAMRGIEWTGTPNSDLEVTDNHLFGAATNPQGAKRTTISGTKADNFIDAAGGNFAPAGGLLTSPKQSVLGFDKGGNVRGTTAPAGAVR